MHEFWRLPVVKKHVGLSRSEIYRRVQDGRFPPPRRYPGSRLIYWPSTEIVQWQQQVMAGG